MSPGEDGKGTVWLLVALAGTLVLSRRGRQRRR
jgi:hypothetical protein